MKKLIPIFLFTLFSLACSLGSFAPAPTLTPEPTQPDTATPLPTATPVTPTLTFTPTPTLIGYKTATPTLAVTDTPSFIPTSTIVVVPTNTFQPSVKMEGFVSVTTSLTEIYKDKGCYPAVVRITAQVSSMVNVEHVLLFARFKSLKAERAAKWTTIEMDLIGAGTFIHDLSSSEMLEDAYFETSWIEYQIVSATEGGSEVGRTDIFKERLKMLECVPVPTPTSANVKP